jgi:hypothetical protein
MMDDSRFIPDAYADYLNHYISLFGEPLFDRSDRPRQTQDRRRA